jgi:uncharacterized protein YcbK (DUF882 family)
MRSKHYVPTDFDSKDQPGSGMNMNQAFIDRLDQLVDRLGYKPGINSGFRTAARNAAVKGSANSAHLRGLAVDLQAMSGRARFQIVQAALQVGITRIGVAKTYVHLDMDQALPGQVIWTY